MNIILLILITVIPFSCLFLRIHDIWHSQGAFFQIGILCAFCYSIFNPKGKNIKNLPITVFTCWVGLVTLYWWNVFLDKGTYNYSVLFPFLNFLCFVLLYNFIVNYLAKEDIERILKYLSYVIVLLCVYCILQIFDLDQFMQHFATTETAKYKDPLMGTIGNPTHLAGYLAMCLPILYYIRNRFTTIAIFLVWVIIILTGSFSGLIGALAVTIFYNLHHRIRFKHEGFMYVIISIFLLVAAWRMGLANLVVNYFNPSGRYEFWKSIYPLFKKHSIIGGGFGLVRSLPGGWEHAHQEFYQLAIEMGVIGLSLAIWCILDCFKRFERSKLHICLFSIFIAFLINCMINYPAHLYLTGVLGIFSYASLYAIQGD